MLYEFLLQNQEKILSMTEKKSLDLAGLRPSSEQFRKGLPIFYQQLLATLKLHVVDGPAIAEAAGRPGEAELAKSAGDHGKELLRLGYTLSHVVHAYGAMCQSITEIATKSNMRISAKDFHELNLCLDIAIAGAVTEFQGCQDMQVHNREIEHLGSLAHELRNALTSANLSLELIKRGTVGFSGSTGMVLEKGMKRIGELIDRSLTEVRLRVDPKIYRQKQTLLSIVDQILLTAQIEARARDQVFHIHIDSSLIINVDQQLFYSVLSNLIQNAMKYTRVGGEIQVRGIQNAKNIVIEVEDECGGLSDSAVDLFKPYEQQNQNRNGLGLGLAIAKRAIELNQGIIELNNLPGKGCIFKIVLQV